MIPFNKTTKEKLEQLLKELGYKVRYEKGHFQSGHCIVHDRKLILVNRFFSTNGRAQALWEVLLTIDDIDTTMLSPEMTSFFHQASAPIS